ncbi:pyridoxal phosphate-dependent transferase [Mycena alexandri]|uniref:Pyridoxal phosphate-dependent transferase n=1 Tax=Mycena alexandri TaxID=1745969 RepID=A0AAD6TEU4_9AGAR|nr:pyridoxal phosphate-dependent transferase [Mycena alexandri]
MSSTAPSSPTTVDIGPFLSQMSKLWKNDGIRSLFPLENIPGMISLLAGRPNSSTFPFESITMKLKPALAGMPAPTDDDDPFTITLENEELNEALQYGMTAGVARLIDWLAELQTHVHKRVQDGSWAITVSAGSQDVMYKTCQALVDDGDYFLVETPVYPGTLGFLATMPCTLIEVHADSQGLNPANLEAILSTWETTNPGKPYPKVLYTIPSGSNPTGASIPEGRKIEVLKLAKKYNFLLLEDDAYAFLYYGPAGQQARSYFALEPEVNAEQGRVVRFDSFSKVLSSGMRLGYMTASPRLCAAVNLITSNTSLQPSTFSQIVAYSVLSRWGPKGFLAHCAGVAEFYRSRRDMFERVAYKHLTGLAEWTTPVAGMFLYIKLRVHSDNREADSWDLISTKAVAKGVLAVPGTAFMPLRGPTPFLRVSFSIIEEPMADEACRRLREVILEARAEAEAASRID